jgi:hypothetical protein
MQVDSGTEGGYVNLGENKTELYARVAFKPTGTSSTQVIQAITTLRNSVHGQALSVGCLPASYTLAIARPFGTDNWVVMDDGPTLIADTWYVIEVHAVVSDSAGVCQVRLDGSLVIDFAGDTLGSGEIANYRYFNVGTDGSLGNKPMLGLFDDLAVNDTTGDHNNSWVGRGGCWPVYVTGAGDLAQFTPSAGDNYACVDEVPANDDTDYVSSDTEGHQDSYAITVPEVSGGVTAFTLWHDAKLAEAGAGNLTQFLRKSGVNYDGDLKGLDTTYRHVSHTWETNPATGAAWTLADLEEFYVGQETS